MILFVLYLLIFVAGARICATGRLELFHLEVTGNGAKVIGLLFALLLPVDITFQGIATIFWRDLPLWLGYFRGALPMAVFCLIVYVLVREQRSDGLAVERTHNKAKNG